MKKYIKYIVLAIIFISLIAVYKYLSTRVVLPEELDASCRALGNPKEDIDIFAASQSNNCARIIRLVEKGVEVNVPNENQEYPLLISTKFKNKVITDVLLELDADIRVVDNKGKNLMHYAATNGDIDLVNYLIGMKVDFDLVDQFGYTPLYYSVANKQLEVTNKLLEIGANPNTEFPNKEQLLRIAIDQDNLELFKTLIINKANIELMDSDDLSTFEYFAQTKLFTFETFDFIKDSLANETLSEKSTQWIKNISLFQALESNQLDAVPTLLKEGADPSWNFNRAIVNENYDPLTLNYAKYPTDYLIKNPNPSLLKVMIEQYNAFVSMDAINYLEKSTLKEEEKQEILLILAHSKNEETLKSLLLSSVSHGNDELFVELTKNVNSAWYKELFTYETETKPLLEWAVLGQSTNIMDFLLSSGVNINELLVGPYNTTYTVLHVSIKNDDYSTVKYLLAKGANRKLGVPNALDYALALKKELATNPPSNLNKIIYYLRNR